MSDGVCIGLQYLVKTPVADQIPATTEMALFYPAAMALVTGQIGESGLAFAEQFLPFMEACVKAGRTIQDETQRLQAGKAFTIEFVGTRY